MRVRVVPLPPPSLPSLVSVEPSSLAPPRLLVGECPLGLGGGLVDSSAPKNFTLKEQKHQPLPILSLSWRRQVVVVVVWIYIYIYGSIHPCMEVFYSSYFYSSFYYYYCKYLHAYMVM